MNLENIQAGMRVPNYRKLCDLLGEPIEEGNSKNAQIRRWEQYFAYSREKKCIHHHGGVPDTASDPRPANEICTASDPHYPSAPGYILRIRAHYGSVVCATENG